MEGSGGERVESGFGPLGVLEGKEEGRRRGQVVWKERVRSVCGWKEGVSFSRRCRVCREGLSASVVSVPQLPQKLRG